MKFDELRLRFDLIDDEPSRKLCLSLAQAILGIRRHIEYMVSPESKPISRQEQVQWLRWMLSLCQEKGRQLIDEHPESRYLLLRVSILDEMTNEMLPNELEDESEREEATESSVTLPASEKPSSPEAGIDCE
ncbi:MULTISPECIES: hypothetical protein [Komagataeibacter]|uniref:Uncharacterized protein n=1 Tax=Komagataeibacter oboediens TaxID=65958 RepID=A0ABS5SS86_9PROT|nr:MULTISPECIES: hypothetical protein [Komagataeibacter]MBE7731331.1 hypothetical protein [Komagataeibacter sp. FXV3]MBT0677101.1 hypothetical protein [Komagataeibacter oboediens]MBT0680429.1 hypothetical protein [Komagataeibacter oboediens]